LYLIIIYFTTNLEGINSITIHLFLDEDSLKS
jgi:hypothetical protein